MSDERDDRIHFYISSGLRLGVAARQIYAHINSRGRNVGGDARHKMMDSALDPGPDRPRATRPELPPSFTLATPTRVNHRTDR